MIRHPLEGEEEGEKSFGRGPWYFIHKTCYSYLKKRFVKFCDLSVSWLSFYWRFSSLGRTLEITVSNWQPNRGWLVIQIYADIIFIDRVKPQGKINNLWLLKQKCGGIRRKKMIDSQIREQSHPKVIFR